MSNDEWLAKGQRYCRDHAIAWGVLPVPHSGIAPVKDRLCPVDSTYTASGTSSARAAGTPLTNRGGQAMIQFPPDASHLPPDTPRLS